MVAIVGLGVIGAAAILFAGIGLVSMWRRSRKEAARKKQGDREGSTLYAHRDRTGFNWRRRPDLDD